MESVIFEHFVPLGGSAATELVELPKPAELAHAIVQLWGRCADGGRDGLRRLLHQMQLYARLGPGGRAQGDGQPRAYSPQQPRWSLSRHRPTHLPTLQP